MSAKRRKTVIKSFHSWLKKYLPKEYEKLMNKEKKYGEPHIKFCFEWDYLEMYATKRVRHKESLKCLGGIKYKGYSGVSGPIESETNT